MQKMARPSFLFVVLAVFAVAAFAMACRPGKRESPEGLRMFPRGIRAAPPCVDHRPPRTVTGSRRYSPWGAPFFRGLRNEHRVSTLGPTGAYAHTIDPRTGKYVAPHPPISPAGVFRNAKMVTCVSSPECAYGVDDGKSCDVPHTDALSAPLPPFAATECHAEGRCYRGSCCNYDAHQLAV